MFIQMVEAMAARVCVTICMSFCVCEACNINTTEEQISCHSLGLLLSYKVNTLSLRLRAYTHTRTHTPHTLEQLLSYPSISNQLHHWPNARACTHTHTPSCVCYATASSDQTAKPFLMFRHMKTKCGSSAAEGLERAGEGQR